MLPEIIGTFVLVLGVLAILSPKNLNPQTGFPSGLGPALVGLFVWSIGLSLGGPTGYAINPARDLGPRLAHAILPIAGKGPSDWSYAWVPIRESAHRRRSAALSFTSCAGIQAESH